MKRFYAFILVIVLCTLSLTACGKLETSGNAKKTEVLLYDFENYDRNFQLMRVMAFFGAVNVNEEAEYVKSGSKSALIQPLGPHSTAKNSNGGDLPQNSCLYVPFTSYTYEFDYADCAKIQSVKTAVYNAEETEVTMYIGLIFDKVAKTISEPIAFSLQPGWNEVVYLLDHNVLSINYNLQACYGMAISFDRVGSRELKDAPKLYMDDIRLVTTNKAVKPEKVQILDENAMCDFESLSHKYIVASSVYDMVRKPDINVVTAADYDFTAISGQKMLRVALKPATHVDGSIYEGISFTKALVDALDFANLEETDSFCFELYNDSDVAIDFTVLFRLPKANRDVGAHLYANPKQWNSFSIGIDDLRITTTEEVLDYREDAGEIKIHYQEFSGKERVLYIDNIRIEK